MYEFSHEQKNIPPIQYFSYFHNTPLMFATAKFGADTFWLSQKLKDKRPRVGLNHQPFGILN